MPIHSEGNPNPIELWRAFYSWRRMVQKLVDLTKEISLQVQMKRVGPNATVRVRPRRLGAEDQALSFTGRKK